MVSARNGLLFAGLVGAFLFAAPAGQAMVLTSTNFTNGGTLSSAQVNSRCGGQNRSPELSWTGAPANTKSFAVTLFDPDANHGNGFWHWLAYNISANTASLPEGTGLPADAVQATNDFGTTGFGGACPPPSSGPHHYQFTLYALDASKAPFGADAKAAGAVAWFKAHALATATLTGLYRR
jgi:hypothetical protein